MSSLGGERKTKRLRAQGWKEIDGDYQSQSTKPEDIAIWADMMKAFEEYWAKDKEAPGELWQPHHTNLCKMAIELANEGHNVAIGFAIYKTVARDFVRSQMPDDFRFVHVDVTPAVLMDRHFIRGKRMTEESGVSMEAMWAMDAYGMPEAR